MQQKKLNESFALRVRARPLYELVVEHAFRVENVLVEENQVRTIMQVLPRDEEIPVRTLAFAGYSTVKRGDEIRARIPRYEEEPLPAVLTHPNDQRPEGNIYLPREFREQEEAIEISILTGNEVVKRERSTTYDRFVRSKPPSH